MRLRFALALATSLIATQAAAEVPAPSLRIHARTRLDLRAVERTSDKTLVIEGVLLDDPSGDGLGDQAVAIQLTGPTGSSGGVARTRRDGSFRLTLPLGPAGQYELAASAGGDEFRAPPHPVGRALRPYELPEVGPHDDVSTAPASLAPAPTATTPIAPPAPKKKDAVEVVAPPIPLGWYLLPPGTLLLLVVGGWLARTQPWRRKQVVAPVDKPAAPSIKPGLALGTRAAGLGPRIADHGLDGIVWDAAFDRAVAGATLHLALDGAGDEHTAQSDAEGRFSVAALAAGSWHAVVRAPGYVAERFVFTLPHRGELRRMRVGLEPVRIRVLAIFRDATTPRLAAARRAVRFTPRETMGELRLEPRARAHLAAFTSLVEEAYFAPRIADEGAIEAATRLAAALGSVETSAHDD